MVHHPDLFVFSWLAFPRSISLFFEMKLLGAKQKEVSIVIQSNLWPSGIWNAVSLFQQGSMVALQDTLDVHVKQWDDWVTYPCPDFNGDLIRRWSYGMDK